jgi:hypothetical protein
LGDEQALLVDHCDKSESEDIYGLFYREMKDKTSEPLSEDEEKEVVRELGELLFLGYRMRDLAHTIDYISQKKRK